MKAEAVRSITSILSQGKELGGQMFHFEEGRGRQFRISPYLVQPKLEEKQKSLLNFPRK